MKTLRTLLFIFCLGFMLQVNAQNPEKKAKNLVAKMTEVMSLTPAEAEAVYAIQLERFKAVKEINEKYEDDPETKKEMLKQNGNKTFNEMKKVVGQERLKLWKEHQTKN